MKKGKLGISQYRVCCYELEYIIRELGLAYIPIYRNYESSMKVHTR